MKTGQERGEIKITVQDYEGNTIEELGTCITDSPNKALQMYEFATVKWSRQGYAAKLGWEYTK